jgi:Zn-dependent protease with chaperone function
MNAFQHLAELMLGRVVDSLVIGSLLAFVVWVLLRVLARLGSAVRFASCFSALAVIAGLFFFVGDGPSHGGRGLGAHPALAIPARWALYMFLAWASGALIACLRLVAGLWHLRRLHHGSVRLDQQAFEFRPVAHADRARIHRCVSVCVSADVRVPTAIGFFRPVILLPAWTLQELSPDELKTVVLHEMAHLDRWDDWTNLAQKLLRALLFFHPAVWWIDKRLTTEREMACDDLVLVQVTNARQYAQCLVSLAEKSFLRRPLALAQAAVGRLKSTAQRVTRILDGKQRRLAPVWKPALAALTVFSVAGFVGIEHTPQLVGFTENSGPTQLSAAPQLAHAVVIPASLQIPAIPRKAHEANRSASSTKEVVRPRIHREPSPAIAKLGTEIPASAPRFVNARAAADAQPQVVFVVFQTRQYDGSGGVIVTTTVWKFKVGGPAPVQPQPVSPRST